MYDYTYYYYYRQYDESEVPYKFVRDIILDPDNIKKHFQKEFINNEDDFTDYAYEYKHTLFNQDKETRDNHRHFVSMINDCDFDYHYLMFRIITPVSFEYAEEYNITTDMVGWIKDQKDNKIFALYALSIADEIIEEYNDYIRNIVNDTTTEKIAISKLKRNRIVNEGILLKLSMKNCGMF